MKFLKIIFILYFFVQGTLCQPRRSNVSVYTNQFIYPLRQLQMHRIYQILIRQAGFAIKNDRKASNNGNKALEKATEELKDLQKWQHWDLMLV